MLWQASNEASSFEPFSLARLELRVPNRDAMAAARQTREQPQAADINDNVHDVHTDAGKDDSFATRR